MTIPTTKHETHSESTHSFVSSAVTSPSNGEDVTRRDSSVIVSSMEATIQSSDSRATVATTKTNDALTTTSLNVPASVLNTTSMELLLLATTSVITAKPHNADDVDVVTGMTEIVTSEGVVASTTTQTQRQESEIATSASVSASSMSQAHSTSATTMPPPQMSSDATQENYASTTDDPDTTTALVENFTIDDDYWESMTTDDVTSGNATGLVHRYSTSWSGPCDELRANESLREHFEKALLFSFPSKFNASSVVVKNVTCDPFTVSLETSSAFDTAFAIASQLVVEIINIERNHSFALINVSQLIDDVTRGFDDVTSVTISTAHVTQVIPLAITVELTFDGDCADLGLTPSAQHPASASRTASKQPIDDVMSESLTIQSSPTPGAAIGDNSTLSIVDGLEISTESTRDETREAPTTHAPAQNATTQSELNDISSSTQDLRVKPNGSTAADSTILYNSSQSPAAIETIITTAFPPHDNTTEFLNTSDDTMTSFNEQNFTNDVTTTSSDRNSFTTDVSSADHDSSVTNHSSDDFSQVTTFAPIRDKNETVTTLANVTINTDHFHSEVTTNFQETNQTVTGNDVTVSEVYPKIILLKNFRTKVQKGLCKALNISENDVSVEDVWCGSVKVRVKLLGVQLDDVVATLNDQPESLHVDVDRPSDSNLSFRVTYLTVDGDVMWQAAVPTQEVVTSDAPAPTRPIEDDDGFELREYAVILIIVFAVVAFFVVCVVIAYALHRCAVSRRSKSFSLNESRMPSVEMEDFTLTKIDRPMPLYTDSGLILNPQLNNKTNRPVSIYSNASTADMTPTGPLTLSKKSLDNLMNPVYEAEREESPGHDNMSYSSEDILNTDASTGNLSFQDLPPANRR